MLHRYKDVYTKLKNKKVFGIYDEDRVEIAGYLLNLNCMAFEGLLLVDDNDTTIPLCQLSKEDMEKVVVYMESKLNE